MESRLTISASHASIYSIHYTIFLGTFDQQKISTRSASISQIKHSTFEMNTSNTELL